MKGYNSKKMKKIVAETLSRQVLEYERLMAEERALLKERKAALRKWDKIRANKTKESQEWVRSNKQ